MLFGGNVWRDGRERDHSINMSLTSSATALYNLHNNVCACEQTGKNITHLVHKEAAFEFKEDQALSTIKLLQLEDLGNLKSSTFSNNCRLMQIAIIGRGT